ncbi:DMA protein, partial [Galbula dea]|nr:DMA protein [Galbula dea]
EPPTHTLAEVFFCQPPSPSLGLVLSFDWDQLFWFHFPTSSWRPRLSSFPPWPPQLETPSQLLLDVHLCQDLLHNLTQLVAGKIPEAKGIPVANIFPLFPPSLGEANTLVCMVENIFPPAVEISWQLNGVQVTQGVTNTYYTPTEDLTFTRFSYLKVTPVAGEVYTCIITQEGDNTSVISYWVPQAPVPSEVLETALCGATTVLGVLLALLGITMMMVARR